MGHFLRCGLRSRVSVFLCGWSRFDSSKNLQQIFRLLSTGILEHEDDISSEDKASKSTARKHFFADLNKFQNENKISLPRSTVKTEDFVAGPHSDPDTFGTLNNKNPYLLNVHEGSEDDQMEDEFTSELPNYLPQKEYAQRIKKFLSQRRFGDALNVLQVTMLKEDRVKPEYYIYSILIAYCGHNGNSKMALRLFNDMKKRGLPVFASIYTSLFNAFSNSPFHSDGLNKTRHLLSLMTEKGIELNHITCHALIKAFGRCGSLEEAFKVADYMMSKKMELKPETVSFLFHACISDKEAGFRHALLVYRKMRQYCITPDTIHFNLLLHCIRDCSIGDIESTIDMLKKMGVEHVEKLLEEKVRVPQLNAGYAWEEDEEISATTVTGSTYQSQQGGLTASFEKSIPTSILPNLFSRQPSLGCIVSLAEMATPQDRLFLLGGVEGFLDEMAKSNAKSDIKTLSLLLQCGPETCAAEESLLKYISKHCLQTDLLFFNTLIRRRVKRRQYSEAKEVLSMIAAHGFQPDLMTFTNLAMTCRSLTDAYELLKALDDSGLRPGIELITALLGCASTTYQIKYVYFILDVIDYEEMKVNSYFMKKMDSFYEKCLRVSKIRPEKFSRSLDAIDNFCIKYPQLKANLKVEAEQHPGNYINQKYQQNSNTDTDFLENYVEPNAHKPKFPRLGPTAAPKVRAVKLKKLREENPENFHSKGNSKNLVVKKLEGIDSVVYQQLALTKPEPL